MSTIWNSITKPLAVVNSYDPVDEVSNYPKELRYTSGAGPHSVDLYWTEKWRMLWDFLQLYALLWQAANPWSWPSSWLRFTWVSVFFNLDLFSSLPPGALNGASAKLGTKYGVFELGGDYGFYALGYALGAPFLLLCWWLAVRSTGVYGKGTQMERHFYTDFALIVAQVHMAVLCFVPRRFRYFLFLFLSSFFPSLQPQSLLLRLSCDHPL
jgi:hypothetical protein